MCWCAVKKLLTHSLRSWGIYRQSVKNLLNADTSSTCLHNMVNFGLQRRWDLLAGLGHPLQFQWLSRLSSVTARQSSSGRQPNFAALNRECHLYSARWPSRWALAHILVLHASNTSETRAKMFSKTSTACRLQKLTLTFKLVRVRDQTRLPCGANPFSGSQDISYTKKLEQRCFFKHEQHAGRQNHPSRWAAFWHRFQRARYNASCNKTDDGSTQQVFCPWWSWSLTLTFQLVRARDQTRLPCELCANPFSRSWDIWFTNTESAKYRTLRSSLCVVKKERQSQKMKTKVQCNYIQLITGLKCQWRH